MADARMRQHISFKAIHSRGTVGLGLQVRAGDRISADSLVDDRPPDGRRHGQALGNDVLPPVMAIQRRACAVCNRIAECNDCRSRRCRMHIERFQPERCRGFAREGLTVFGLRLIARVVRGNIRSNDSARMLAGRDIDSSHEYAQR